MDTNNSFPGIVVAIFLKMFFLFSLAFKWLGNITFIMHIKQSFNSIGTLFRSATT